MRAGLLASSLHGLSSRRIFHARRTRRVRRGTYVRQGHPWAEWRRDFGGSANLLTTAARVKLAAPRKGAVHERLCGRGVRAEGVEAGAHALPGSLEGRAQRHAEALLHL